MVVLAGVSGVEAGVMPTIGPDRLIKARKPHRCYLCGLRIRKGATYYQRAGVEGAEHWSIRMHAVCRDASSGWDEDDWMTHDEWEFRRNELGMRPDWMFYLYAEILRGARG